MKQYYGNGKLLADFSKRTGIRDPKTEAIVIAASFDFKWDGAETTTTTRALLPAIMGFSGSVSGTLVPDEMRKAILALPSVKPDISKCPGMYGSIYFNFQVAHPPWYSHLRPALSGVDDEEREEMPPIDEYELYEGEWKLRDILPRDGWIPREA